MQPKDMRTPDEHRLEDELRVCDPAEVGKTYDIKHSRIERMGRELYEGFEALRKHRLAVTFFGSARSTVGDEIYQATSELAGYLSKSGFTVITGGGGGIMEAANRGAFEAGGASVGLNISIPEEQTLNKYTTESKKFNYFFTRKVMLTFASEVYIYFPGGFGTFDELFEILTLIQTRKIKRLPIILYGKAYWDPIVKLIDEHLLERFHTIDKEDTGLYTVVDSVDEAYHAVLDQVKC
ncbi:MAG: TIGR00730 family Rossman fold protein [Candidatus Paceibacteria bacterium]